jgi:hypothetical protein
MSRMSSQAQIAGAVSTGDNVHRPVRAPEIGAA